jgi:O-antigen ligase
VTQVKTDLTHRYVWVFATIAAIALGGLSALSSSAALAAVGALVVLGMLIFSARGRLIVVLVGGLLIFQSDAALGPAKYAYLGASMLAVILSLIRLRRSSDPVVRCFWPLLPASATLFLVLLMSGVVATSAGTSLIDWFRDVSSYFFVVFLPAVALDASEKFSRRQIEGLLVALGTVAAVGFAVDWISRRGVSSLQFGRLLLATTTLVALAFTYTLMRAAIGPRRLLWIALCAFIFAMMVVSGTRTSFVLLAAVLGLVGSAAKARVPIHGLFAKLALIGLLLFALIPTLGRLLTSDQKFLAARIRSMEAILSGDFASDASFQERAQSYAVAKSAFMHSPWFGVGPGHAFPSGRSLRDASASLDTPWVVAAKFGLMGLAALAVYLISVLLCGAAVCRRFGWQEILTVGRGWVVSLLFLVPFGPWIEDKGFALALALYLAALATAARAVYRERSSLAQIHEQPRWNASPVY